MSWLTVLTMPNKSIMGKPTVLSPQSCSFFTTDPSGLGSWTRRDCWLIRCKAPGHRRRARRRRSWGPGRLRAGAPASRIPSLTSISAWQQETGARWHLIESPTRWMDSLAPPGTSTAATPLSGPASAAPIPRRLVAHPPRLDGRVGSRLGGGTCRRAPDGQGS
jgi:hypothetical protein